MLLKTLLSRLDVLRIPPNILWKIEMDDLLK
jgi:hypothetical protein